MDVISDCQMGVCSPDFLMEWPADSPHPRLYPLYSGSWRDQYYPGPSRTALQEETLKSAGEMSGEDVVPGPQVVDKTALICIVILFLLFLVALVSLQTMYVLSFSSHNSKSMFSLAVLSQTQNTDS
ncbi:hypothetical protein MJG53_006706 [Ovis ammon polii x Ovis aries]|uniref:Uncharacterized protein n=2 Tax=Ovis TaxID=9935 RepID=A0A836A875_SHEEP|nr:hypothetical protein JEQ12_015835 [Ovis aries]KAI4585172.1 hypothetical protein MJG53_006706 [Ovis ammon polii x Ovis aries]